MFKLKKIKNLFLKKRIIIQVIFLSSFFLFLFFKTTLAQDTVNTDPGLASEGVAAAVNFLLSLIAYVITAAFGALSVVVISIIVNVAQFNNIINIDPVSLGWTIIRDICNMFFILILLVIAFATILRKEEYAAKSLLPKLLIAAVLINFSKTIFGLIIDFSQVVMLTFVAAFAENGAANFINAFNVQSWWRADGLGVEDAVNKNTALTDWSITMAIIGGMVASVVTLIVLVIMLAVLVIRIVMLWIYTILSPLVFLGQGFPPIKKFTSNIWEDFIKNVVVGPILAFFIWLALVIGAMSSKDVNISLGGQGNFVDKCGSNLSSFFCNGDFQKFIIIIGLLCGGLLVTQKMGGAIGALGGKGLAWSKKAGLAPLKIAKTGLGYGADKLHEKTGVDLNLARVWKGVQEKRHEIKAERYAAGMKKAEQAMDEKGVLWGALAMTGTPGTAWEQIRTLKGIGRRFKGGKSSTDDRKKAEEDLDGNEETGEMGLIKQREQYWDTKDRKNKLKEVVDSRKELKQTQLEIESHKGFRDIAKTDKEKEEHNNRISELSAKATQLQENIKKGEKDLNTKIVDNNTAKTLDKEIEKRQTIIKNNMPSYDFEARAADQKVVNEKAGKIKDIKDPQELLKILEEAINSKDKAMVKAISKKMASNYDDNEFLKPLVGRTDAIGIQKYCKMLQDKVGFTQQEAGDLGSEIGMINKGTNHWAATLPFKMKNGKWVESSEKERNAFRSTEVGKMHAQRQCREINRLGYGYHDKDGYHIDAGGIVTLKVLDTTDGQVEVRRNMNESAAKHLWGSRDQLEKLVKSGEISQNLFEAIKARATSMTTNYDEATDRINKILKT